MGNYKLVPLDPTREMWAAAGDAVVALTSQHHDAISEAVYKAMLDAAPKIKQTPIFRSAKDGEHWPDVGAKYLVRINGVLQEEIYEFDQGDCDYGLGDFFWDRPGLDECPLFDSDNDEWLPISVLSNW